MSTHEEATPEPLYIALQGADSETLNRLTLQLRSELRDMDVGSVGMERGGPPPPGAKSPEALTDVLFIAVGAGITEGIAKYLAEFLIAWMARQNIHLRLGVRLAGRSVEFAPQARDANDAEKQAFVDSVQEAARQQPDNLPH